MKIIMKVENEKETQITRIRSGRGGEFNDIKVGECLKQAPRSWYEGLAIF